MKNLAVIGVDWGSTNFRAWGFNEHGALVGETAAAVGLKAVGNSRGFEATFLECCGDWLEHSPQALIILCGMVGARGGWKEAPYVTCPVDPRLLVHEAIRFKINQHDAIILPGALSEGNDAADVMRGEEVQILGAALRHGLEDARFCIPGTHCKWARLQEGKLVDFRTHLTGELFQVLSTHSLLGKLAEGSEFDQASFKRGLTRGREVPLSHAVFATRANVLAGRLRPEHVGAFLSGVLIGAEIAAEPVDDLPLILLAAPEHAERYAMALDYFGRSYRVCDAGDATRAGLTMAAGSVVSADVVSAGAGGAA